MSSASSIGAAWPPVSASFERMRGFYDHTVIETGEDVATFLDTYQQVTDDFANQEALTRLSIRFVAQSRQLRILEASGVSLEGAIPLANTPGLVLAYAGQNKPERTVQEQHMQTHLQNIQTVVDTPHLSHHHEVSFTRGVISPNTPEAVRTQLEPHFLDLYGIFGYGPSEVHELLANPANTIMYAERDGQIISTAMAEHASILIGRLGTLNLVEITEASTRPEYRRQGLYAAVSGLLVQQVLAEGIPGGIHAIYGESNAGMPGVMHAAVQNGRRFAVQDRDVYNLQNPHFGILPQNVYVHDGQETRQYNDFAVSYVPQTTGETT